MNEIKNEIFSKEQVVIGKMRLSKRKVWGNYAGHRKVEVSLPSGLTTEQFYALKRGRCYVSVVSWIRWSDGKAPLKADAVWDVWSNFGSDEHGRVIAWDLTYKQAIEVAVDYIYAANPHVK